MAKKREVKKKPGRSPVREARGTIPEGYAELLGQLKERIRNARLRAALAVNHELVLLYWQIGREILHRQEKEG